MYAMWRDLHRRVRHQATHHQRPRRRANQQFVPFVRQAVSRRPNSHEALVGALEREKPFVQQMRQNVPQQSPAEASHAIASQQIRHMRRLLRRVPRRPVADEPSTFAFERLRSSVSVQGMRQNIWFAQFTADSYANSHGRAAIWLSVLLEGICRWRNVAETRADSYG